MTLRSSSAPPRGHPAPLWRFRHEPEAAPARPIIGGVRTDLPPGPSSLRSRRCLAPAPNRSAKASPPTGRDMGMAALYGTNSGDVLQGTETWEIGRASCRERVESSVRDAVFRDNKQ